MPLTTDMAYDLAKAFSDASYAIDQYRFKNWQNIAPAQYQSLEDVSLQLFLNSQNLTTMAVGLNLANMASDVQAIQNATAQANQAIKTLTMVNNIIAVGASLVSLAGAIISQNPIAAMQAVQGVITAVQNNPPTPATTGA